MKNKYLHSLTKQYTPKRGPANTVLGEILRAYKWIINEWEKHNRTFLPQRKETHEMTGYELMTCKAIYDLSGVSYVSPLINYLRNSKNLTEEFRQQINKIINKYSAQTRIEKYYTNKNKYNIKFITPLEHTVEKYIRTNYNTLANTKNTEDSTLYKKIRYTIPTEK